MSILIQTLSIYPLKSCAPIALKESFVNNRGLLNDRIFMVIDSNGVAITARENTMLLKVNVLFENSQITFRIMKKELRVDKSNLNNPKIIVNIFGSQFLATTVSKAADAWFSKNINTACRLVMMSENDIRPVLKKHNGQTGDILNFADQNPILLISKASLNELNNRLEIPVTMRHFRPNIVVDGCEAFAEDNWSHININNINYRVSQSCVRCQFTTINPITTDKEKNQEPLRTLAQFRYDKEMKGVIFGVHLVPIIDNIKENLIRVGNTLEVINHT